MCDHHGRFHSLLCIALQSIPLFVFSYAMIVEDNKVKKLFVEPDGTGLTCSLSQNLLDAAKKGK